MRAELQFLHSRFVMVVIFKQYLTWEMVGTIAIYLEAIQIEPSLVSETWETKLLEDHRWLCKHDFSSHYDREFGRIVLVQLLFTSHYAFSPRKFN